MNWYVEHVLLYVNRPLSITSSWGSGLLMVKHQRFAWVRLESMRLRLNVGGSTANSDVRDAWKKPGRQFLELVRIYSELRVYQYHYLLSFPVPVRNKNRVARQVSQD